MQFAVGDALRRRVGTVRLEDDRDLVAVFGQVAIQAVDAGVEFAVVEPADVEVVGTFEALLSKHSFFGFEYGQTPEAAVIGAEKGTRWLYDCMQFYADKHFLMPEGKTCTTVLPRHMLNIFRSKYKIDLFDDGRIQEFKDLQLTVYPYYVFSPKKYLSLYG